MMIGGGSKEMSLKNRWESKREVEEQSRGGKGEQGKRLQLSADPCTK